MSRIIKFYLLNGAKKDDAELIYYPDTFESEYTKANIDTWEHLLADACIFPSRGQARKNGFSGVIPHGYHFIKVGKLKNEIEVLNVSKLKDISNCICNWCTQITPWQ